MATSVGTLGTLWGALCSPLPTPSPKVSGYEYTYRLQRMFTDMDVSADLNKVYLFCIYIASMPSVFMLGVEGGWARVWHWH